MAHSIFLIYIFIPNIYIFSFNLSFVHLTHCVCFCLVQGIVIGTGENSEFGEVFKMMQAEEVSYAYERFNINR